MLVQPRRDTVRLVRQHDHAMLAGALAGAWRAPPFPDGLPWTTVVATSLHDIVWIEEDAEPRLDPRVGVPRTFTRLGEARRVAMLRHGLPVVEALEPEIGALVREHHEALLEGRPPEGTPARWIRFFDALSLFACLTGPGADPDEIPGWLEGDVLRPPNAVEPWETTWLDPGTFRLRPFPFPESALVTRVPYRDLPRRSWPDQAALSAAWRAAPPRTLELRLVP